MPRAQRPQLKAGTICSGQSVRDAAARRKGLKADPRTRSTDPARQRDCQHKDLDGALKEFEEAIAMAPQDSRGTRPSARANGKGKAAEAEKRFRGHRGPADRRAGSPRVGNFLGRPTAGRGRNGFADALKLDPATSGQSRPRRLPRRRRTARAAETYLKALAAMPADVGARVALGEYYLRLGKAAARRRSSHRSPARAAASAPAESGWPPSRTARRTTPRPIGCSTRCSPRNPRTSRRCWPVPACCASKASLATRSWRRRRPWRPPRIPRRRCTNAPSSNSI